MALTTAGIIDERTLILAGVALVCAVLIILALIGQVLNLYVMARMCDARVPLGRLLRLRFRKAPIRAMVLTHIRLRKAGVTDVSFEDIVIHCRYGGRIVLVANTMIVASGLKHSLRWRELTVADIAEQLDAVAPPTPAQRTLGTKLIGAKGAARTAILPVYLGEAVVNGTVRQARADDLPIAAGAAIQVTGVRSSGTLVVKLAG